MGKINIIVAVSANNVIGKGNDLPWHLPKEFKYFKETTKGSTVIMGRKCWESLPQKFRPLPNRLNVVLTKDKDYEADGAIVAHDLESTLKAFKNSSSDIFIIGGAEIYKQSLIYADKLYLTRILSDVEGDVYLEGFFNEEEWDETSVDGIEHEENGLKYKFLVYTKKV
jgi:dihydrofolate reductase